MQTLSEEERKEYRRKYQKRYREAHKQEDPDLEEFLFFASLLEKGKSFGKQFESLSYRNLYFSILSCLGDTPDGKEHRSIKRCMNRKIQTIIGYREKRLKEYEETLRRIANYASSFSSADNIHIFFCSPDYLQALNAERLNIQERLKRYKSRKRYTRELERLRDEGFVVCEGGKYRLSKKGQMLMKKLFL